jgi:adenosylhomocysteine nucleosidase
MKSEASIASGPDAVAVCGNAATLIDTLHGLAGIRLAISFGLCGGLDPALRCGDFVIGTRVMADGHSLDADLGTARLLAQRLAAAGERAHLGAMACVDAPVLTTRAKAELHLATGAAGVDMESLIAGRFAATHGIPLAILRVVSDPADRTVPAIAAIALRPDGSIKLAGVLVRAISSPTQIPSLIAAARDSSMAYRSLRRCRGLPGLFLGLGLAHL